MKIAKECILSFSRFGRRRAGVYKRSYTYIWQDILCAHSCKCTNLHIDICVIFAIMAAHTCTNFYVLLVRRNLSKSFSCIQLCNHSYQHTRTCTHTQRRLFIQYCVVVCALHAWYMFVVVAKVQLQQANYSFNTI